MTKSKTFWALAALISLGIAIFSGYWLYARVSLHFSGDTMEIKQPPLPQAAEEVEPEEAAKEVAGEAPAEEAKEAPRTAPADKKTAEKKAADEKPKAVKQPFEYKDSKARNVFISGSFTSWKDVHMMKKDGAWKATVYILPGTYPYHFVVDGKKKLDPGKPTAPTGDSLIIVTNP